jgi:hypothetical protein
MFSSLPRDVRQVAAWRVVSSWTRNCLLWHETVQIMRRMKAQCNCKVLLYVVFRLHLEYGSLGILLTLITSHLKALTIVACHSRRPLSIIPILFLWAQFRRDERHPKYRSHRTRRCTCRCYSSPNTSHSDTRRPSSSMTVPPLPLKQSNLSSRKLEK